MILDKEVEIGLCSRTIKYYKDKCYQLPYKKNVRGKIIIPKGSRLLVKIEDLTSNSGVYINVQCDYCKKKYKITMENYSKTNHDGKIYCRACAKKLFNSGLLHPKYNQNISIEERMEKRTYEKYSIFIRKVLARDNYKCKCCGSSNNLEVHHLDGYNWCKEKRTDVLNGITLCHNCHSNFHSKYGKGNNTKHQFLEWNKNILDELDDFNGKILPTRKIYCYEENQIYKSINEYGRIHNLNHTGHLYKICNHYNNYKTVNGFHLFWYDEYINMSKEYLNSILSDKPIRKNRKSVICVTTNKKYESINEASNILCINKNSISNCCNHKQNYVYTKNGEKLKFIFEKEFNLMN